VQKLSDGEIYFFIEHGVSLSGMPAFSDHHDSNEIWRTVLWVRHLTNLSPEEKTKIDAEIRAEFSKHEETMRGAMPEDGHSN
jgi:mono/diheme cytochrome c family protein